MNYLGILKSIEKTMEPFTDWIYDNHGNPFLWLGLFFGFLAVFFATAEALKKGK